MTDDFTIGTCVGFLIGAALTYEVYRTYAEPQAWIIVEDSNIIESVDK